MEFGRRRKAFKTQNSRRMAGENVLDRVVKEIEVEDQFRIQQEDCSLDFDSPSCSHNQLGQDKEMIDYLSSVPDPYPLNLEVSTAVGDSGGLLIARQKHHENSVSVLWHFKFNLWRCHYPNPSK